MVKLTQLERSAIYAVYAAIFNLPFALRRKNMLLTTLMGGAAWSWRVTGITVGALEVLEANNYKYAKGKVCRAHMVARIETARRVFDLPQPMPEDEFFKIFWENDKTIITTKSENKTGGTLPEPLPIDYELGLFQSNNLVGWKHGKKEADCLRKLHAAYKVTSA